MVTVELFQPGKVNTQLQFPSNWNDLLLTEIHAVAKALLTTNDVPIRALLLQTFFKTRSKEQNITLPKKLMGKINDEDAVINGYPLFDFLFDKNDLTQQPYNRIKLPGIMPCTVYGPQNAFDNITCGEYEDAHIFYLQFKEEPKPEHLARMMSILWRPGKMLSSLRGTKQSIPYMSINKQTGKLIPYDAEKLYHRFLKLPMWVLFTAYMWYEGCQNHLQELFYDVYSSGGSNPQPSTSDLTPDLMAFTKCIHAGAGPKNGTREQIRCTNLKEFLFDVQLEIQKANEMEKQYHAK